MSSVPARKRTLGDALSEKRAALGRPLVMGILNTTPDSFFPGSRVGAAEAVERGLRMVEAGADILDVGGESTRPGSSGVSAEEEAERVLPVIEGLAAKAGVPISVDTSKAGVASRAREAGARILNDILALRAKGMPAVAARYEIAILMHMLGESPATMQQNPEYKDVYSDIADFLNERREALVGAGGAYESCWVDPGIGFGKGHEHNLAILKQLERFSGVGPLLVGASRKSFIGRIHGTLEKPSPAETRLGGSLAVACRAAEAGAICVRAHDVEETVRALDVWRRIK